MVFRLLTAFPSIMSLGRAAKQSPAQRIYGHIVEAARQPGLYTQLDVPDTVEGRFDMITLHLFFVFRLLRAADEGARDFGQAVFDTMVQDLDDNFRELGVGDTKVGKKVREHAEMFYGRSAAYEAALTADEPLDAMVQVIGRNVYGDEAHPAAPQLARYALAIADKLAAQEAERLEGGMLRFPDVQAPETWPTREVTS